MSQFLEFVVFNVLPFVAGFAFTRALLERRKAEKGRK